MRGEDAGRTQEQPSFCSSSDSAFSRMLFPWVNHFPFLTLHVPFFFLFPTGQAIRQQCSEQPPCAVTMPGPGESLLKLMDSFPGPTGLRGMKTDMQICRRQTDQLQSGDTAHVGRKNKAARCNNRWTSCNLGAGCEGVLLRDGLTQGMSRVISAETMGRRRP